MERTRIARILAGVAMTFALVVGPAQAALADVNIASLTSGPGTTPEPQNIVALTGGGGEITRPTNVAALTGGGGVSRRFVNMASLTAGGTSKPINVASLTGGGGQIVRSTPASVEDNRSDTAWIFVSVVALLLVAVGIAAQRRHDRLAVA